MRITGGQFGGRQLKMSDDNEIRPTTDKVRQAIFNMIAARLDIREMVVADLFCGSGTLGLEALSRGAGFCTFIDFSSKSLAVTKQNIETLGVQHQTKTIKDDAIRVHKVHIEQSVDLVFMDPPFGKRVEEETLENLGKAYWLGYKAMIVVETDRDDIVFPFRFTPLVHKDYGRSKIHILSYEGQ